MSRVATETNVPSLPRNKSATAPTSPLPGSTPLASPVGAGGLSSLPLPPVWSRAGTPLRRRRGGGRAVTRTTTNAAAVGATASRWHTPEGLRCYAAAGVGAARTAGFVAEVGSVDLATVMARAAHPRRCAGRSLRWRLVSQ